MRVITGLAKGTKLFALEGNNTRPTTDRVKESMFSTIQFEIDEESVVLDLFAGSGALGIEALSRGAKKCIFVEHQKSASEIVKKNLEKTRLSEKAELIVSDFKKFLAYNNNIFNIVFLDPPYNTDFANYAISEIKSSEKLAKGGIIIWESAKEEKIPEYFPIYKETIFGNIKFTVFKNI